MTLRRYKSIGGCQDRGGGERARISYQSADWGSCKWPIRREDERRIAREPTFNEFSCLWMEDHRHEDRIPHRNHATCFCRWCWAGGLFHEKPIRLLPATMGSFCYLCAVPGVLWRHG